MLFKSLIKENAVTTLLPHQSSTSERKRGLGKLGQLQRPLSSGLFLSPFADVHPGRLAVRKAREPAARSPGWQGVKAQVLASGSFCLECKTQGPRGSVGGAATAGLVRVAGEFWGLHLGGLPEARRPAVGPGREENMSPFPLGLLACRVAGVTGGALRRGLVGSVSGAWGRLPRAGSGVSDHKAAQGQVRASSPTLCRLWRSDAVRCVRAHPCAVKSTLARTVPGGGSPAPTGRSALEMRAIRRDSRWVAEPGSAGSAAHPQE